MWECGRTIDRRVGSTQTETETQKTAQQWNGESQCASRVLVAMSRLCTAVVLLPVFVWRQGGKSFQYCCGETWMAGAQVTVAVTLDDVDDVNLKALAIAASQAGPTPALP